MLSYEARAWFAALERPEVRSELESIFDAAAAEIADRGPACWASGRCCSFERYGHRLYVTGLEAAYTLARLRESAAAERDALARQRRTPLPQAGAAPRDLDLPALESAEVRGGCPFQADNLCAVHTIKPLGCRLYFCDASAQEWQRDVHERLLARLRALHDERDLPYRYGEWRSMLREALGAPAR